MVFDPDLPVGTNLMKRHCIFLEESRANFVSIGVSFIIPTKTYYPPVESMGAPYKDALETIYILCFFQCFRRLEVVVMVTTNNMLLCRNLPAELYSYPSPKCLLMVSE